MELDELKSAWQQLERQLERRSAIDFAHLKGERFDRMRASLRPLYVGQALQIVFGLGTILLAALVWQRGALPPAAIASGIVLHVYGVVCIASAGLMLARLRRLAYAGAVLAMQQELARLRTTYVRTGLAAGLPWWCLWVPVLIELLALGGVDLYANAPEMVWGSLAVGVLGIAGSLGIYRWTRDPRRARLGRALDAGLIGGSLRRAQAWLDELAAFERS